MKLTNREKLMLTVLACTAIIALGYIYIITPELNRLEVSKQENSKLTDEVAQVKSIISQTNPISKNLEAAVVKAGEKSARLYPELVHDRLILIIDNVIKKSGIEVDSITFTGIKAGDILNNQATDTKMQYQLKDLVQAYINSEAAKQVQASSSQTPQTNTGKASTTPVGQNSLEAAGMTLQIKGDYEQIVRFMTEIEGLRRAIVIDNITISSGIEGMSGSVSITLYGAAKIPGTDTLFGDWIYNNQYGKVNPFK